MPRYIYHPHFKKCDACGMEFPAKSPIQRFCRIPPCHSSLLSRSRHQSIEQVYQPRVGMSACKIVICSKIDEVRDFLFTNALPLSGLAAYSSDVQKIAREAMLSDFNNMRKKYLAMNCDGKPIHRISLAAALFWLAANEMKVTHVEKKRLVELMALNGYNTTACTVRKYVKEVLKSCQKTTA